MWWIIRREYGDGELFRMIHFRKNAFHALSYCLLDGDDRADGFLLSDGMFFKERFPGFN